jgi:DNA-binding response OmpR family regulator
VVDRPVTPCRQPQNKLRCVEAALTEDLQAGPLEVRPAQNIAIVGQRALNLTRHELGLLVALARHSGAVLSREELAAEAWGRPLRPGDRSVDVYVRRLRSKLAAADPNWAFIHTHFAFGYRFGAERSQVFHIRATSP